MLAFRACLLCLQGLPALPSGPAFLAFKACPPLITASLLCLQNLPALPLRPAFFAFTACLVALSLGRQSTNNCFTIAPHEVCTCPCTLQCQSETWNFDSSHVVMPCVSPALHIAMCPKKTCLRLTPLHCRDAQPQHASVQHVFLLSSWE